MSQTIQVQQTDLILYQVIKQVEGDKITIKLIRVKSKNQMATEGKKLANYLIDEYPEFKITDIDIVGNDFIIDGESKK
ncbi:MAG TPA: hypothetical protein VFX18_04885 [Candidatus Nitrosocosmicus sp.]|nr:hypothetical protein [Candidatus Nitrosocosmicus sp.]